MSRFGVLVVAAAAAGLCLAGCASDYDGGYAYDAAYVGPYPAGYVDGYYDDYYGPLYDGYWGPSDVFYYRTRAGGHFHADTGRHFRHDMRGRGYHAFHVRAGQAPAAGQPAHHRRGDHR